MKKTTDFNLIKLNYSLLGGLMEYERNLNNNASAELRFGITFRDFIFETFKAYNLNLCVDLQGYNGLSNGMAYQAGISYYPKGFENFGGVSLNTMLSYRDYKLGADVSNFGTLSAHSSFSPPEYCFTNMQFKVNYRDDSWRYDVYSEIYL